MHKFTRTCRENNVISILYICIHTVPTGLLTKYPQCIDWLVKDENGNVLPQSMYHLNKHFRRTRREYWIVYPDKEKIEVYLLERGNYKFKGTFLKHHILEVNIIEGLKINLEEVF